MGRLLEVAVGHHVADAGMDEVGAVGIFLCQLRHIVVGSGAERTCAESQTVVRVGHGVKESLNVGVAGDDARKAENLQRGSSGGHTC